MKTQIYFTILVFSIFVLPGLYSQNPVKCFVNAGPDQIVYETNNPQVFSSQNLHPSQRVLSIHLHLVANSFYDFYPDSAGVQLALDNLNDAFKRSGISFRYCKIDSIINYKYDNFSIETEIEEVKTLYYKAGVINVYVVGDIKQSGIITHVEGYTFFPGGDDIIVISKGSFVQKDGLSHQMGHFFGLYNTYEVAFGDELVDGSNCNTAGDLICDTPADVPVLTDICNPLQTLFDANGDKYNHPLDNIMSANWFCRCEFSIAQINKMVYNLENNRSYLK